MGISTQYIVLEIEGELFGVDTKSVVLIEKPLHITRVPKSPKNILGVVNYRGEIIPVIDLKRELRLKYVDLNLDYRIIIIKVEQVKFGLIVDSVDCVIQLDSDLIESAAIIEKDEHMKFIDGLANYDGKIIMLIDPKAFCNSL